ncbi:Protein of unknown function [Pyronema omphalodes CBS 100304]|uniref:Uncharacterized protein n=1 Tax=Pyronema omphalodes (strain CBS 100304) TaxID=1076935 RepID=U4LJ23_PYROM|nr:Protein of unknown function [Pyronema omphalodes CBS 100304]
MQKPKLHRMHFFSLLEIKNNLLLIWVWGMQYTICTQFIHFQSLFN